MKTNKAALVIAAALGISAGSAQAVTLYDQDGTRMNLHGRLAMGIVNIDGDSEFSNIGTRFGFRFDHAVDQDLAVFANTEYRYAADQKNSTPMLIRNTFLGARFAGVGNVYAGNFDSIYFQQVSNVLDIPQNWGFRALNGGAQRAHGDSIAFDSADFGGFRFGLSAKHQAEVTGSVDPDDDREEATSAMAYLGYRIGKLNLAVGYDQANEDFTDGNEDALVGFRADYSVLSNLWTGALVEVQGDVTHYGLSAVYGYGPGSIYGIASHLDNDGDKDNQYAAGINYKFSQPMFVYAEMASGNAFASDVRPIVTLGARYNF